MRKVVVIYDDNRIPDRDIRNITGNKSFGATIFKRVSLKDRTEEIIRGLSVCGDFATNEDALYEENAYSYEPVYFKLYSNMAIKDAEAFEILLEKALYAKEAYRITQDGKIAALMAPTLSMLSARTEEFPEIVSEAFLDLSKVANFRQFITSGFDARYFNALSGDDYTVVKHSANKEKLKREYTYYGLLPDDMKTYYAMPYDYREEEELASYRMERYHMTDLAIRFVHGAISTDEFREICEKLFHFIKLRHVKEVSEETYQSDAKALYVDKVTKRIEMLKECNAYPELAKLIASGTDYEDIDGIVAHYLRLYEKILAGKRFQNVLVVGHGDLCFSNILYSNESSLMRLIDPKGALSEEELYMNPYYDLAKLSHSICGSYDYFNSDLFEISVDENLKLHLGVDCDNAAYIEIYKEFLNRYSLDYKLIRLYEASLFLSMLPLHIDRRKKVLGFILNAIEILRELDEN